MAAADGKTAMAESESESADGVNVVRVDGNGEEEEITLIGALRRLFAAIFSAADPSSTFLRRAWAAIVDGAASVRIGCRNSSQELIRWTRRGSPLRPLLVVSIDGNLDNRLEI